MTHVRRGAQANSYGEWADAPRTTAARRRTTLARELIDHLDHRHWERVGSLAGTGTGCGAPGGERTQQAREKRGTRVLAFDSLGEGLRIHEDARGGNGL